MNNISSQIIQSEQQAQTGLIYYQDDSEKSERSIHQKIKSQEQNYMQIQIEYQKDKQSTIQTEQKQYKQVYSDFFKDAKDQIFPIMNLSKQRLKRYRIVIQNNQDMAHQRFIKPFIEVKYIQEDGCIVNYTYAIGCFQLEIIMLNLDINAPQSNLKTNNLGSGSFSLVRKEHYSGATIAVKRQYFQLETYFQPEIGIKANQIQIQSAINEYAFHKICSLYQIGPLVCLELGFDILCYNDCIQFHLEVCGRLNDASIKSKILTQNGYQKFKSDIKKCLYTLHSFRLIHKDIKPGNILFSPKFNKFVLSDFGISHSILQTIGQKTRTFKEGTIAYMSEEMYNLKEQGMVNLYENDLFALQCIFKQYDKMIEKYFKKKEKSIKSQINNIYQQGFESRSQSKSNSDSQINNEEIVDDEDIKDDDNKDIKNININMCKINYSFLILKFNALKINANLQNLDNHWKQISQDQLNTILELVIDSCDINKIKEAYKQTMILYNAYNRKAKKQILYKLEDRIHESKFKIEVKKEDNQLKLRNFIKVYRYSNQSKNALLNIVDYDKKFPMITEKIMKYKQKLNYRNLKNVVYNQLYFGQKLRFIKQLQTNINELLENPTPINKGQIFKLYLILLENQEYIDKGLIIKRIEQLDYVINDQEQICFKIMNFNYQTSKQERDQILDTIIKKFESLTFDNQIQKIHYYLILAQIYRDLGKNKQSLKLLQRILDFEEIFRYEIPLSGVYEKISFQHLILGNFKQSLNYCQKCLKIYQKLYLENNIVYGNIYLTLSQCYFNLKSYKKSLNFAFRSMKIKSKIYGAKHRILLVDYIQLAIIYQRFKPNQTQFAKYFLRKAQSLQYHQNQLNRPNAFIYYELAKLNLSNFDLALTYCFKSLEIFTNLYSENIDVAHCNHLLSDIYYRMGNFQLSIEYSIKSFNIVTKLQLDHFLISLHYYQMAQIYLCQGKCVKALQYSFKSIQVNHNNVKLSLFYYITSQILEQLSRYDQALKYIQKAIEVDLNQPEKDNIRLANNYYQMSIIYNKMGWFDQSLKSCIHSINLASNILGTQSQYLSIKYHQLSLIYKNLEKYEEAINFQKKCILLKKNSKQSLTIYYYQLGQLYLRTEKLDLAMEYCYKSINQVNSSNQVHKAINYILLIRIYAQLRQFGKAIKYASMSQQILKRLNMMFTDIGSSIYHHLSVTYSYMNKIHTAIAFNTKYLSVICQFTQIDKLQCAIPLKVVGDYYFYLLKKFIVSHFYLHESLKIYLAYFPITNQTVQKTFHILDLIAERTDLAWNFKSFNHFCVSIQKKIAKLKLLQLHKMLNELKIILKFVNTFKNGSKSHLECLVKISLCYKYLNIRRYYVKYVDIIKRINFELSNQDQIDFKNLCQAAFT